MSPSIYPFIRGSANQNRRSPFDRSSDSFFLGLGTSIKYKICFAIDLGSLEMDSWVFPNIFYMMELNCIIGTLLFSL